MTIFKFIKISDRSAYVFSIDSFPSKHEQLLIKYLVLSVAGVDIVSASSQLGMIWEINTTTWKTHRSMLLKWIVLQILHCALNLASEDTLRKCRRTPAPVSFFSVFHVPLPIC